MSIMFGKKQKVFRSNPVESIDGEYKISGGTIDSEGNYIEPEAYTSFETKLNIQPDQLNNTNSEYLASLKGRDLRGIIKIYSDEKLKHIDGNNKGDKVVYDGGVYEVFVTGKYPSYHKARAILTKDKVADFT